MKRLWIVGLAVTVAPGLWAQQPQAADTGEAGRLRAQIEQRFNDRVLEDLQLSPDQATELRSTQEKFGAQRRTLMQQQMERRRALNDQMQPGIAANADSVRKLMDGMQTGRAQLLKIDQDENQQLSGYLTPVQRARYQQMRERLMQRGGEVRAQSHAGQMGRMGGGRPFRGGGRGLRP